MTKNMNSVQQFKIKYRKWSVSENDMSTGIYRNINQVIDRHIMHYASSENRYGMTARDINRPQRILELLL